MISGGPMMGQALFSLDFPVAKTSSALTTFTKDQVAAMEPSAWNALSADAVHMLVRQDGR